MHQLDHIPGKGRPARLPVIVTFSWTKVMRRITKAHARGASTRIWLPMRWLNGERNGFRRHERPSSPNCTRHRRPTYPPAGAELRGHAGSQRSRTYGSSELALRD